MIRFSVCPAQPALRRGPCTQAALDAVRAASLSAFLREYQSSTNVLEHECESCLWIRRIERDVSTASLQDTEQSDDHLHRTFKRLPRPELRDRRRRISSSGLVDWHVGLVLQRSNSRPRRQLQQPRANVPTCSSNNSDDTFRWKYLCRPVRVDLELKRSDSLD